MFLVFDGIDGSGKTTQLERLAERLRQHGRLVTTVRDPGGTAIGQRIRELVLDRSAAEMVLTCEVLLLFAARAQSVEQVIRPALERGEVVLSDRYVSASLAYQGAGGGFDQAKLRQLAEIACGGLRPDRTLIFDVDFDEARRRLARARPGGPDRIEARGPAYFARVAAGFRALTVADPKQYIRVDASADPDTVAERIWGELAPLLTERTRR